MLSVESVAGTIKFEISPRIEGAQLLKEINLYLLSQAYNVQPPLAYRYNTWQPWLKGYHGEDSVGVFNLTNWPNFVWIDQELKEAMGY